MNQHKAMVKPRAAVEAELLARLFCGPLTACEAADWLTRHCADEALDCLVARGSVVVDPGTGTIHLDQGMYRRALDRLADAVFTPSLPGQRGEDDVDPFPAA